MAQEDDQPQSPDMASDADIPARAPRRRVWRWVFLGVFLAMFGVVLYGWLSREQIARDLISGQLEALGLPAQYEIESIGTKRQVLRNIVIGDPERPDLTIDRASVSIRARFGTPDIGRITLENPRLYGSYHGGQLSFGSLDRLIFTDSKEPFRLPDLDLAIAGGRGLLETDYGPIGLSLGGQGRLRDGFSGYFAALALDAEAWGCRTKRASLFVKIAVNKEKPAIDGPVRVAGLACSEAKLALANADLELDAVLDQPLDGGEGQFAFASKDMAKGADVLRTLTGKGRLAYRKGNVTARYDFAGERLTTGQANLGRVGLEGVVRTAGDFARIEAEGTLEGEDVQLGNGLDDAIAGLAETAKGTLAAPLLSNVRTALKRESRGSSVHAGFLLRRTGDVMSLVMPSASLRGGSGTALFALSRFQATMAEGSAPRISGNFATGGKGLPRIAGRMERQAAGGLMMRIRMPEYRAEDARLAIPELVVAQSNSGAYGFAGQVALSGPLPGGAAQNLVLPVDGNWSPSRGLALWRKCIEVRFDRLALANLSLTRRSVPVCPSSSGAIVRTDGSGLKVAGGVPSLDLVGVLGDTPIRIASGPVGFAVPGTMAARTVKVSLGPPDAASRFEIARLDARIGSDIGGTFEGSAVYLDAVPLDLLDTGGNWRYVNDRLEIAGATFVLQDRETEDRFQPLIASDAHLELAGGIITAEARMREPTSEREIVRAQIRHDLNTGGGGADLFVDGIVFDDRLQPDMVSRLALGVVANAEGVVTGRGHIDWTGPEVRSTGTFSTDNLDFAAAFGPVQGASGRIVFTDLLGMVTAPDQQIRLATMNPGIEVLDGVITYELRPDSVLAIKEGHWPFLGGTLRLEPAVMNMGVAETRRYTLKITALDVAKLLAQMDLANLSATGIFDGSIPLVFDEDGGHLDGGHLQSRPPGGNLSYVGELTYEDLSTMANMAFDALKSIDYHDMRVDLEGNLEGEIITRIAFDGLRQGEAASKNFITKRIAKLPIRFKVNIRAPFFQLATSLRSMYDPAYVRDPRTLGLIDESGAIVPRPPGARVQPLAPVQPLESEAMP
ncbi:MAG: YdbH domain-containing protein [Novosphingobium sp.]|nr:YdbH domain-containing protein [Novosphingobium sp.]